MSGKRSRGNAIRKMLTRPGDVTPEVRPKCCKEQWVIRVATRIVGTKMGAGFVQSDDVVSDILMKLLDAGGFNWEQEEIERFCQREAAFVVRRYVGRKERSECEFSDAEGEAVPLERIAGVTSPMQELHFEAMEALGFIRALPRSQRRALEILCGGGNPINVAEEMSLTPWRAIQLINEARQNIRRVDAVA